MVFTKFVEIGRICFVPSNKQIYTIVDVLDNRHVIIDSPRKDSRTKINLNNIQLTKFKLEFLHGARTKTVAAAWAAADLDTKWAETRWAKNIVKKGLRANLGDFDRFKLMKLKQAKRQIVNSQLKKMK
jgi:large subunit ribosomal protein L14e